MSVSLEPRFLGANTFKRIREALEKLDEALASIGGDKLRVTVVDSLPESPFNLTKIAGTALTARDWSSDFAKLQNLDVALSTRASESTLSGIKSQVDKLKFDSNNYLYVNLGSDSVGLARDSTLQSIYNKLDALDDALQSVGKDKLEVTLYGYDGSEWRPLKVTSEGKVVGVLG